MSWFFGAYKKYAVFSGRARRKEYWFFILFLTIALLLLSIVDRVTGTWDPMFDLGLFTLIWRSVAQFQRLPSPYGVYTIQTVAVGGF